MEDSTSVKYNLSWGNSVVIREAFLQTSSSNLFTLSYDRLMGFDYPSHEGDPELIDITRDVILRQTGRAYNHVFLTNGATGACMIAMRAYQLRGYKYCSTRSAPYYVKYPSMIRSAGLTHVVASNFYNNYTIMLLDLPSNPLGILSGSNDRIGIPTILDGVYLNNVYMPINILYLPKHDVMVGSYSKLTGINGIRLGWVATNDDVLARSMKELVTSEYCGLSASATELLKFLLYRFNWEYFEITAKAKLDLNRESWSKLERFFSRAVPNVGMFHYTAADKKCQELLKKAGIQWTSGSDLGTDDGHIRINLGAKNQVIDEAVKAVLRADKV